MPQVRSFHIGNIERVINNFIPFVAYPWEKAVGSAGVSSNGCFPDYPGKITLNQLYLKKRKGYLRNSIFNGKLNGEEKCRKDA